MEKWVLMIRDDVSLQSAQNALNAHGLTLATNGRVSTNRHLECRAPVNVHTVKNTICTVTKVQVENILTLGEGETWFDVYPLDDASLSTTDHMVSTVLNLSDPSLLRASHIGTRYEVEFAAPHAKVEAYREQLFVLGIELGPNPTWLPSPAIQARTSQEASDFCGENI